MKLYIITGSVFAALAILFGAFGSHALKEKLTLEQLEIYDIATRYLMFHALGIFAIGILGYQVPSEVLIWPLLIMVFGILIFSGSLYLISLAGYKKLGMVTPIGGLALIISWLMVAYNIYKLS
jgi:uncharacterized membrane protein YgdD (TMEM256/DUF423 family)|tara:strand:+ start:174 stop:542 length:369 start_codon:yes stop_codon:yes gene_type:complete